jgi:hypothetical protein
MNAGWPREESNLRPQIRSLPLYPLSYGALFVHRSADRATDAQARAAEGRSLARRPGALPIWHGR